MYSIDPVGPHLWAAKPVLRAAPTRFGDDAAISYPMDVLACKIEDSQQVERGASASLHRAVMASSRPA
jgi:hypothetical protein